MVSETHGELSKTTSYDPFDRVTVQNVTKAGTSKKTRFNYLGTSEQVAAEERWDTGASAWKQVRAYGYGPDGKPLVMQSTPITGEVKTRFYSTSTHGDTEALTDPDTGNVTAAYRYTAYGAPDFNDNAGEDPVAQKDDASNPADPTKDALNPYRYSSKRIDSATGDYDMGFRNYSPGLNRFLTRDMYNGALSDLKLGMDPWNTNRYAFAGGNPITRIELDGHRAIGPDGEEVPLDGGSDGSSDPVEVDPDLAALLLPPLTEGTPDSPSTLDLMEPAIRPGTPSGPGTRADLARPYGVEHRPWYGYFWPTDVRDQAENLSIGAHLRGFEQAGDMLDHWLSNSGDDYELDVSEMLKELPAFEGTVDKYLASVKGKSRFDSGWRQTDTGTDNADWYFAVYNFQYRASGGSSGKHSWASIQVYKRYNFGTEEEGRNDLFLPNKKFTIYQIHQPDMSRLHTLGLARDYDAVGGTFRWW